MSLQVSSAQSALPLEIPEGIRYNCQGCGRCCSGWAVGLTEDDYLKVKDIQWSDVHPELAGRELFVHTQEQFGQGLALYPHHTKAREDGSCSFLVDSRCIIHSTLGEQNKPATCQLFPYTFVITPSGIYVGVSFASMAAARNLGDLLSEQRQQLESMWQTMVGQQKSLGEASEATSLLAASIDSSNLSKVSYKIDLSADTLLSWEEYLQLEAALINTIHSPEDQSIFDIFLTSGRILSKSLAVKRAGDSLNKPGEFKPGKPQYTSQSPSAFEKLLLNLLCFRYFEWPQIRKRYGVLPFKSHANPLTKPAVVASAVRAVFTGKIDFAGIGQVGTQDIAKFQVEQFSPEVEALFRRYLYLKLFSKTYCGPALSGLSVIAGFNNLIANVLSAIAYAKAQSISRDCNFVNIADLYEALVVIDREGLMLAKMSSDKAALYDLGFASPRLFNRLLAEMSAGIGPQ